MKVYFYMDNGTQRGPLYFDQLKAAGISKETPVWCEDFDDWKQAGTVPEFSEFFEETPPPMPDIVVADDPEPDYAPDEPSRPVNEIDNTKMFRNFLFFRGRARRLEYWIVMIVFSVFEILIDYVEEDIFLAILLIAFPFMMWCMLSEGTRRCHDLGHSGWFQFIPFYGIFMAFERGRSGSNIYGNNPKGE